MGWDGTHLPQLLCHHHLLSEISDADPNMLIDEFVVVESAETAA